MKHIAGSAVEMNMHGKFMVACGVSRIDVHVGFHEDHG